MMKKKKCDDRLTFWKDICKYENGCRIESTDMLTGVKSEYSYEDIVNELVSINQRIAAFTADPCGYASFYLHRIDEDNLTFTTTRKTTTDISLRTMEDTIKNIGEHGEDKYPMYMEEISLQMPSPHDLRQIRWFDGDTTSRKISLEEYIPYIGNNYFNLKIADVSEIKVDDKAVVPAKPKKEDTVVVQETLKPADTETYSFSDLKFKKIGDLSIFAKKSTSEIVVMLWKPDSAASPTGNKYEIVLHDQAGNKQPIILHKKKLLLFRYTSGVTYSVAIRGYLGTAL